ncbi:hypothetical protein [Halobaculum limi]|uniref:hypothetical protein n=1 Tax=Halobaculum limi TaxID=3031916 RepID=UPI0024049A66|nr:hypothetical protein [Halobaculum sp. YSMS11]
MDLTGSLVRLGSLVAVLGSLAAFGLLFVNLTADGVPLVGLLATFLFVVVAVVAAIAWGRRLALVRGETPYW